MANIISAVWRHKVISGILIVVIAGGAYYFWPREANTGTAVYAYGTAQLGNIVQTVSGTGQVSTTDQVDVKAKVAGTVTAVDAKAGQTVKSGDVLAMLDSTDAQAAYDTAKANLENARLTLQKSQQDNSASLIQAQNSLAGANDQLELSKSNLAKTYEQAFNTVTSTFGDLPAIMAGMDDILNGSNSVVIQNDSSYFSYYQHAITSAGGNTANLLSVGSTYTAAKSSYDNVFAEYKGASRYSDPASVAKLVDDSNDAAKKISNAVKALISLIQQYRDVVLSNNGTPQSFSTTQLNSLNTYSTQANSDLVGLISTQQSIKSAIQAVETAQQSVDQQNQSLQTLQTLTNPISVNTQQQNVTQKETALADAVQTLGYYTIAAPFDGVVTAVSVNRGDEITANTALATIITNQQIAVVSLNEVDVANVKTGQKATMTFDAIGDLTIVGHVTDVETVGTVSQGVVSYNVTIAFDTADDRVKPGMSVTANIITQTKQNVLLVPGAAIKSGTSGSYVLVAESESAAAGASAKQQAVTTGLSDSTSTEITQGLSEGQIVVVSTTTSKTSTSGSATNRSIFNFGGGGAGR